MSNAFNKGVSVNLKSVITVTLLSIAYLVISRIVVGYKSDQLVLVGLCNILFYLSSITRKFVIAFLIIIVYWIIFDYMKAFPNYKVAAVHIADLYNFEKKVFGIKLGNQVLTPNEYFRMHGTQFLDIMGGFFYLCWIPVPLAFGAYLFFTRPKEYLGFAFTFFLVNLLGFVVYYTFPAAPPWYVHLHGYNFIPSTPGNIGGLIKFDNYFHTQVFKNIYAKSSNVFAAMPSLHSSYPVIVLYYGIKNRLGLFNIVLATVMVGIWFTAVYTSQHYICDVLAGITCATIGINLFNYILRHSARFQRFVENYRRLIA